MENCLKWSFVVETMAFRFGSFSNFNIECCEFESCLCSALEARWDYLVENFYCFHFDWNCNCWWFKHKHEHELLQFIIPTRKIMTFEKWVFIDCDISRKIQFCGVGVLCFVEHSWAQQKPLLQWKTLSTLFQIFINSSPAVQNKRCHD